jgi:hypothetical protein
MAPTDTESFRLGSGRGAPSASAGFVRMILGEGDPALADAGRLYALAGAELG